MPCEYECAVILLVLWNQIADQSNRRTLGRFTPYGLLTLPEKASLKLHFFRKVHLLSFLIAPAGFWPLQGFSPEAKTRGISKCKKVSTVSKVVVSEKNLDLIKLGAHGCLG